MILGQKDRIPGTSDPRSWKTPCPRARETPRAPHRHHHHQGTSRQRHRPGDPRTRSRHGTGLTSGSCVLHATGQRAVIVTSQRDIRQSRVSSRHSRRFLRPDCGMSPLCAARSARQHSDRRRCVALTAHLAGAVGRDRLLCVEEAVQCHCGLLGRGIPGAHAVAGERPVGFGFPVEHSEAAEALDSLM